MAYVSTSDPLPQHGGLPPTVECINRRTAAVEFARCVSRTGRLVAYSTLPPLSSFMPIPGGESPQFPEAAYNAPSILRQSELARAAVLSGERGLLPPAESQPSMRSSVPVVVPLSWIPANIGVCGDVPSIAPTSTGLEQGPVMPLRLPAGLSGASPRWGDAFLAGADGGAAPGPGSSAAGAACDGFVGWIRCNPWLAAALGLGTLVVIGRSRGR